MQNWTVFVVHVNQSSKVTLKIEPVLKRTFFYQIEIGEIYSQKMWCVSHKTCIKHSRRKNYNNNL